MKAEQRKHLETNSLVEGVTTLLHKSKEGLSRNTWIVVSVIGLAVVLFLIWRTFSSMSFTRNAELWVSWDRLGELEDVEKAAREIDEQSKANSELLMGVERRERIEGHLLDNFAAKNQGTIQSRMARFQLARLALYEGLRTLAAPATKERALKRLDLAATTYAKLADESRDIQPLHEEALLNCGKAYEALNKIEQAKEYYKRLEAAYPKSVSAEDARAQLKRLETDADTVAALGADLTKLPAPPSPELAPKK